MNDVPIRIWFAGPCLNNGRLEGRYLDVPPTTRASGMFRSGGHPDPWEIKPMASYQNMTAARDGWYYDAETSSWVEMRCEARLNTMLRAQAESMRQRCLDIALAHGGNAAAIEIAALPLPEPYEVVAMRAEPDYMREAQEHFAELDAIVRTAMGERERRGR